MLKFKKNSFPPFRKFVDLIFYKKKKIHYIYLTVKLVVPSACSDVKHVIVSNAAFITVQTAEPKLILVPAVKPLPVRVNTVPP